MVLNYEVQGLEHFLVPVIHAQRDMNEEIFQYFDETNICIYLGSGIPYLDILHLTSLPWYQEYCDTETSNIGKIRLHSMKIYELLKIQATL